MIDLEFTVEGIGAAPHSAVPLLLFRLRIVNATPEFPVENVMLQAQLRIEATHRTYSAAEAERLSELFGAPADWDRTLHGVLWTNAGASVPPFATDCTIDLPVPCSTDFNIAATRYLYGVEEGHVPLALLFSGTVFFRNDDGGLQIGQIPHHKEAGYRLPARIWHDLMAQCYPDGMWLRVGRDVFDAVYRFKRERGLANWDEALRRLLDESRAEARLEENRAEARP